MKTLSANQSVGRLMSNGTVSQKVGETFMKSGTRKPLERLLTHDQMEEFNRLLGIRPDRSKTKIAQSSPHLQLNVKPSFDVIATHKISSIPFQAKSTERTFRQGNMMQYGAMLVNVKSSRLLSNFDECKILKKGARDAEKRQIYLVVNPVSSFK